MRLNYFCLHFPNVPMLSLHFLQIFSPGKENKLSDILLNGLPSADVTLFSVPESDHGLLSLYPSRTIYISVETSVVRVLKPDLLV